MKRHVRLNLFNENDSYLEMLSQMFKEANQNLMELSPIIDVYKVTAFYSSEEKKTPDTPWVEIDVKHQFVFDIRLVPNEFLGMKVNDITIGEFPIEFPEPLTNIPLEEYYNPERYIQFVNRSLPLIRKELKNSDLSKEEALDALTGDFKKHIDWCNFLSKKR